MRNMKFEIKKDEKQIKKLEELLKTFKLLKKEESIYDLLTKSYKDVLSVHKKMFEYQREFLKPIPGKKSDRLFLYVIFLFGYSDMLYTIEVDNTTSEVIKTNINLLRREIGEIIIKEANPFLISLFRWDLDRRNWKHENDKKDFLKKTIHDLDEEIKGNRDNLVKKYISLLLDFFLSNLDIILTNFSDKEFNETKLDKEGAFKMRNQLKQFLDSNKLSEVIDGEIETSIAEQYKQIAQFFLEGLFKSTNRYDYLIAAFIEAQNDYKNIISGVLKSLTESKISNIKKALEQKNIPKFISLIQAIFSTVPNQLLKTTNESHYHINLHIIFKAIGCNIISEVSTNLGRIDSVVELDKLIYIIEYKLKSSEEALLNKRKLKNKSYNNIMSALRIFTGHIIKEFKLSYSSPFEGVNKRHVNYKVISVSKKNFYALLEVVTPENGIKTLSTGERKNLYKDWLINSFWLGLFTGGRRDAVVNVKWSDIRVDENKIPYSIDISDYKYNRAKSDVVSEDEKKVDEIIIYPEFYQYLLKLGFEQHMGSERYILAPESTMKRETMKDVISKAFAHYAQIINPDQKLEFKHLRKTFSTAAYRQFGKEANVLTGHKGMRVVEDHYLDRSVLQKKAREEFKIFE